MANAKAKKQRKNSRAGRRPTGAGSAREAGSKRIQRRRRGRRTLHHMLVLLFLLAGGALLSMTVFFKIERVGITGVDRYDPAELVEFSGIQIGDNLFRVDTGDVERRLLEAYPYIESVRARRTLPPAIELEIVQSIAAAVIDNGDEHILFARDGKILERGFLLLSDDVLLVRGLDAGDRQPGERMGSWTYESRPSRDETAEEQAARLQRNADRQAHAEQETEALVMLEYLWTAMEATGFTEVTNVDLTDRLNMKIIYEGRLTLLLGTEADLEDKLLFIQLAIESLHPEAHGVLNVADARGDRLVYAAADGYNRDDGSPQAEMPPALSEEQPNAAALTEVER